MLKLTKAGQRRHVVRDGQEAWFTQFSGNNGHAAASAFGILVILAEMRSRPGARVALQVDGPTEVITYVLEGAVLFQDRHGNSGLLYAGEFRQMTAQCLVGYHERPAAPENWVHMFRIGLASTERRDEIAEQKRFTLAERQGILCVVASPDGTKSSLKVHEDARIFSAVLEPGQFVVHELLPGRGAWVHIVRGEVSVAGILLSPGDGLGISEERSVSLLARTASEVLLVDLGMAKPSKTEALVVPRERFGRHRERRIRRRR